MTDHPLQQSFLAVQITYFGDAVTTKAALLLLYYRIFGVNSTFRRTIYLSGFVITAYFIACTIAAIAGCQPVSYFWNKSQPGHCMDEVNFFRWNGIASMLMDFLILCLPLPMTWRIKANRRQKIILSGIFLLGFLFVLLPPSPENVHRWRLTIYRTASVLFPSSVSLPSTAPTRETQPTPPSTLPHGPPSSNLLQSSAVACRPCDRCFGAYTVRRRTTPRPVPRAAPAPSERQQSTSPISRRGPVAKGAARWGSHGSPRKTAVCQSRH
jgi:hypothetical protein